MSGLLVDNGSFGTSWLWKMVGFSSEEAAADPPLLSSSGLVTVVCSSTGESTASSDCLVPDRTNKAYKSSKYVKASPSSS